MKSLIEFSHILLEDIGKGCGVSTSRDSKTVAARVEHEGLSFLTITLPQFAKDFEKSLADLRVADDSFYGFRRWGGLPRFLGGFLQLVFDRASGALLDAPSIEAIRAIRQFCMAFAKIELPCTPARERKAIDDYIKCEQEVEYWNSQDHSRELSLLTKASTILFSGLLTSLDQAVYDETLIPKHGSGSTADGILGNKKYHIRSWSRRLEAVFPMVDWVIPSHRHWDYLADVDLLEPEDEIPVKVISVPKTLKTPRIIAKEPHYAQYAQQAVMEMVFEYVKRDDILFSYIGFQDQTPNQELARIGSRDGTLATLDLSEASDRVSTQHVEALLRNHSLAREAVFACRSFKAEVPGYGIRTLSKFAPMGSALCFPFEAMVFLAIVFIGIAEARSVPLDRHLVNQMRGQVRVYGDDIIVPVDCAPSVMSWLEAFGLKVNVHKSFLTGMFRESCGGDYFAGVQVTPVRVRSMFPASRECVDEIVSTVSLRNQLYEHGYERCVEFLDKRLSRLLGVWPAVPVGHPSLGRWTHDPVYGVRVSRDLQIPLVKVPVVKATIPIDDLDGIGALMKYFLRRGDKPLALDAFRRAGRASSARITTKWLPIG